MLVFLTDTTRVGNPHGVLAGLPRFTTPQCHPLQAQLAGSPLSGAGVKSRSAVILRDYAHPDRLGLARALRRTARRWGHIFLVAGDAALARRVRADGLHMPEALLRGSVVQGLPVISTACHSRRALIRAHRLGVPLKLTSPVFDSASDGGKTGMGIHRAARMIWDVPGATALGGVTPVTAKALKSLGFSGCAAIGGLVRARRSF